MEVCTVKMMIINSQISNMLKELKFVIVPVVNPDGYEVSCNELLVKYYTFGYDSPFFLLFFCLPQYTWTTNRLWRKNRRPGAGCDGVDLNRNYNDHWVGLKFLAIFSQEIQ